MAVFFYAILKQPKVAIVADWLTVSGGAEAVIDSLHEIYPHAPIFTTVSVQEFVSFSDPQPSIKTSNLQKLPRAIRKRHPFLLHFLPKAIESLDLRDYDVIISSSSFVGKGVLTRPNQLHICYCHSPTRYLWGDWQEYIELFPMPKMMKRVLPKLLTKLRIWDLSAAQRPDQYIANSDFIATGIEKYYRRKAVVISPPVDTKRFATKTPQQKQNYYLGFGRLVPQKKFDVLIEAFKTMPEKQLVIAGTGRNEGELKKQAEDYKNITFLGYVPDDEIPELMSQAKALLFPQIEDAGITCLEALAAGTPVIAYGKGGATTTLQDGKTGIFFYEQTAQAIADAVERLATGNRQFASKDLIEHAKQYDKVLFQKKIKEFIEKAVKDFWK
jgi:glycosyltransferase involved in cell wall biosynthesis